MHDHSCSELKCQGQKYAACNLNCSRCLSPKYIECVSGRTEIDNLLKCLNIVPDTKTRSNASEHLTKLNQLFFPDSLIEFVCPSCKNSGSFLEVKKEYEDQIKNYKKKNTDLTKEKNKLEDKIKQTNETQCVECTEFINEIQTLKSEINQLKANDKSDVCAQLRIENEQLGEKITSLSNELCDLNSKTNDNSYSTLSSIGEIVAEIDKSIEEQNDLLKRIERSRCVIADKLRSLNQCDPKVKM